ncbi:MULTISPECIES: MFS transporter [Streptomyces]|uniref:MFS transporter n=2 Tax=Streptomyces TaxID=1883 RepID=A0ABX0Z1D2_STRTL|nr:MULTISPECIES: MFS transporter [Streptomyces]MCM3265903.1 MFS transporter [Streptomyces thermoviolaceus]NJP17254.1 MFS transporter [Streptomyces thermoviolaceus subsp. thermoviolaceus]RSR95446.1 MFS transporter [Streptomyces sp. WAC00469]GGV84424.1 MFS transporter [Streptomyces thermoviolaceus subsp. apingens]GHB10640.1 MFS transporter [Streptomyces thermoviolaceus subsp. thermoviolaceus]
MRRIHVGNALSAFGLGFTVPYLYVYVAQVRGLGSVTAGLVLAVFAAAALVVLPFAGRAIVRRGPLQVLLAALVLAALGSLCLGLSGGVAPVLLSAAALGAGQAVMQPALATMIVDCSTAENRSRAFAMQFFLQNLGLGVGGLIGGHLVDTTRLSSFTLLFSLQAAVFLLLVALMATVRMPKAPRLQQTAAQAGTARASWRQLLGDRTMVQLCVLGFVLFFACYGQFESGLSAYGVEAAGVSTSTLGTALAANTLMIVVAQFVVLRFVERRRRTRVIATVGVVWAVAWAVAAYAGLGDGSRAMATAAFVSTYALFGLGEVMLSPTLAPLVADLAPEGMAGQYNSAFALVKQLALAIGPAVGGPLAAALPGPYVLAFTVVSLAVSVLALRLGRSLTVAQDHPWAVRGRVVARGGPAAETMTADA